MTDEPKPSAESLVQSQTSKEETLEPEAEKDSSSEEESTEEQYEEKYNEESSEEEVEDDGEWDRVKPKEHKKDNHVFEITDKLGEKKITLHKKGGEGGERVKIIVKMPYDGHEYCSRNIHLKVIIKKEDGNKEVFRVQTYHSFKKFDCGGNYAGQEEKTAYLKTRGIGYEIDIFLRHYMIEKFLKEKFFPNLEHFEDSESE